jgi:hypothetical protein
MATFYESIAQSEMDDFGDYDKAANCLKDALKVLTKGHLELSPEYQELDRRLACVTQFAKIKAAFATKQNLQQVTQVRRACRH